MIGIVRALVPKTNDPAYVDIKNGYKIIINITELITLLY